MTENNVLFFKGLNQIYLFKRQVLYMGQCWVDVYADDAVF